MTTCAKSTERAAIYLEAARRVVERDYGRFGNETHCPDIAIGTTDPDYRRDPERHEFRTVFGTSVGSWNDSSAGILALCFMAAMVEAGDA